MIWPHPLRRESELTQIPRVRIVIAQARNAPDDDAQRSAERACVHPNIGIARCPAADALLANAAFAMHLAKQHNRVRIRR
jgi:hypothetical protein